MRVVGWFWAGLFLALSFCVFGRTREVRARDGVCKCMCFRLLIVAGRPVVQDERCLPPGNDGEMR